MAVMTLTGCRGAGPTGPALRGSGPRALFIGNSYLFHQDIPGLVQAMATASGDALAVATLAAPDVALIDHWHDGGAAREIAKGGWTWVVLQQGPSSTDLNRDTLRLATQLFAERIRAVQAMPALFSAWPASARTQDFPRAIESYTLAAGDVQGMLLPVAVGWLETWERDPAAALYADGLHPSGAGAYVSALVIYACLLGKSPMGLPATLDIIGVGRFSIPAATATMLQAAAADAVAPGCGTPAP